ncbi:MAG: flagellar hook-basal body complex protein [Lachnospiraceae bacterium]|nr:flagellar hook-basal body complex protein [Clostridiales bacterium]MBR5368758.1 flagellar hook-basal body complex protein [Lachnospiraceae bacterium]
MMRSLFSGVAGLKTHQTKMDVIGNNIANVNTVAYKSQNVTFQELMYQTTQSASAANAATGRGGINAKQIGLGVQTGAINANISTSGASQTTGNPFDIQIKGDSFFIVSDGSNNYFTRAGAFYVDGMGNLAMTSNGYTVMGWQEDPNEPGTIIKDTVTPLKIMSAENMTSEPEQTRQTYLSGIIDKNSTQLSSTTGLIVNFGIYDSLGYSYIAKFAVKETATEGQFTFEPVDLIDSEGYSLMWSCDDTKPNYKKGYEKTAYDAPGGPGEGGKGGDWPKELTVDLTGHDDANLNGYINFDTITGKSLDVDSNGNDVEFTINIGKIDAFDAPITLVTGESTMYDNKGTSTVKGNAGDYNGNFAGRKVGEMSGVAIGQDGKITATYDNGTSKLLGQIAVANFSNPSGLEKKGDNLYQSTPNSGAFDGIGDDITSGSGAMSTGVLEMSNVDLSAEFTDMITTQRGFQANSRIITVSDSMLEELTNLKR